ncbi:MAG: metallophosphoesterase [Carbonactinosporaceae bacterium]
MSMTRRSGVALTAAIALLGALPSTLGAPEPVWAKSERKPLFEFGVVADAQYCDCETKGPRHYRLSLAKLAEAAETFNQRDLAFTIQLGDIIDRDLASFSEILPVYEQVEGTRYHVLGNHDFPVTTEEIVEILDMPNQYYDFSLTGWRFVVLDTNDISVYANPDGSPKDRQGETVREVLSWTGDVNAHPWNGGVGSEQMTWLEGVLDDAELKDERVVVFAHMPVFPLNEHNAWNDDALLDLLEPHDSVVAYFNGHNHAGNFGEQDGIYHVSFQGMVNLTSNAYATVRVYPDRLQIDGYGREPDRTLRIRRDSQ